jgi:hemerythrin
MPLVVWSEALSVGVKSVDDQHAVLFNAINDLHAAMMKGSARSMVGELLCRLLVYTRSHFSAEEELMDSAQWSGLSQHKLLHRDLTGKVEQYIARFEKGDLSLSVDLAGFLSDWLATHIQKVDKMYTPCLHEHGIR